MKMSEQFCGQGNGYSRSITVRNKLIPVGKTEENLKSANLLNSDFERAQAYTEVKNLIDEFHRAFIEDILSKTKLDWETLYDQFDLFQAENDSSKKAKQKKELEVLQGKMRNKIAEKFKGDERFEKLFKKELLSDLLPSIIRDDDSGTITDKQTALNTFKGFATYFTGFHQNRKNLYSDEAKATAISNRIVNENFPKFYANVNVFEYVQKNFPNIVTDTENSLKDFLKGKKLSEIFSKDNFNAVLSQHGIDFYNTVIGGFSGEAGSEKVQGLNEKINLAQQQLPAEEKSKLRKKMTMLYKQILSDKKTASFIPVGFEKSEEVYNAVRQYKEQNFDKARHTIDELISNPDYDLNQIFVPAKELSAFSLSVFGSWSIAVSGLFLLEKDKAKKELSEKQIENITKQIAKNDYSLIELQVAYSRWAKENDEQIDKSITISAYTYRTDENTKEKKSVNILEKVSEAYAKIDFERQENLQAEKEAAMPIKNFLDEVQNLYHYFKLFDYRGEEEKDSNFYSKLDEILSDLAEIIPFYNRVRNFVTKKPGEVKKVKLNFECSSFLNVWGRDFGAKDAHIFIYGEKYYLGIINEKLNNEDIERLKIASDCKHVIYDSQTPDNKNTPRLFIRSKGTSFAPAVEKYNLPIESVMDLYDKRLFKTNNRDKNQKEYKEALVKIIDYFKLGFTRHESYKNYPFCWKNSNQYNDIAEFYSDTIKSCYRLKFENISYENLLSLVDSGKLYLFQIYNKDFAEKSSGKKNLHTLYWENLFSEENLRDVCLKLNEEAELFFRPKNENAKEIRHEKGSVLVNRTTADGKSIPEEIYQEIYQFKNKKRASVSDEAQKWLDGGTVVCKKATHTLTKDRHFTQDTYLFHCPITMNFKAPEITGKKFNQKVLDYLHKNPDVKIIGLDRGERHLIYLSLINQNGEIELQKTLNLVEQVRNDKTISVNYQEKLVQKEGDRDKARKNWQTIGNIKELKEGYLSNVVHEIAKLMVEHNAIVVMEDLNFGFKRGRFAVERQVYQKFENMLIEKLNYLVFKNRAATEPGGVLNAYQLTDKSANVSDVGKQSGFLFYVPAAYTSKIDPKTGFADLLNLRDLTNVHKKRDFFSKFDEVRYDTETESFAFTFDYKNFDGKGKSEMSATKWTVYSREKRIVYSPKSKSHSDVYPTNELKKIFNQSSIDFESGNNLIDSIMEIGADLKQNEKPTSDVANFWDALLRNFKLILQMRNSNAASGEDYIISPVKNADGTFFDSRKEKELGNKAKLPTDADANGAYHIALKGLLLLKRFDKTEESNMKKADLKISNADWIEFAQNRKV